MKKMLYKKIGRYCWIVDEPTLNPIDGLPCFTEKEIIQIRQMNPGIDELNKIFDLKLYLGAELETENEPKNVQEEIGYTKPSPQKSGQENHPGNPSPTNVLPFDDARARIAAEYSVKIKEKVSSAEIKGIKIQPENFKQPDFPYADETYSFAQQLKAVENMAIKCGGYRNLRYQRK